MTSNVGSQFILNNTDDDAKKIAYEKIKQRVMDAARSIFRPEFMNKVDEYIVFQPLDPDMINSIVRLQKRVADRKMKIGIIDAAVDLLGSLVYDPNYEARLVKRVIQQNIENELTKGILRRFQGRWQSNRYRGYIVFRKRSFSRRLRQKQQILKKKMISQNRAVEKRHL